MAIRVRGRPFVAEQIVLGAVQFFGQEAGRVQVDLSSNPPANVGAGDFTFSCWIRPSSSGNNRSGGGVESNIFMDRDRLSPNLGGFGLGLDAGRISLWLDRSGGGSTAINATGSTDLRDNAWHYIELSRTQSTGLLQVWVDDAREINASGPSGGSVQYSAIGGEGANDRYLTYGAEKHGFEGYSYTGYLAECAWFNAVLNSGSTIVVPSAPWALDAAGMVAYHRFVEESGTTIVDELDGSHGTLVLGGDPVPARSLLSPYG